MADNSVRFVSFDHVGDEGIETGAGLMVELRAPDAATAQARAHHLVDQVRARVGLPLRELPRVWIAPLDDSEESSQRFLAQARELVDDERYELAVVAAQIHLELQVKTLLRQATSGSILQNLVKSHAVATLGNPTSWTVVEALLGVDVRDIPESEELQAHYERRNAIAHLGQAVSRSDAVDSIDVVVRVWKRLLQARRRNA